MAYNEEEFLLISGLEHFRFCRRQWALIHIENMWLENVLTVDGRAMHDRAHDPGLREKRGDLVITRDLAVFSAALGVTGSCDVVEFRRAEKGVPLAGETGLFQPYPVEYKHGSPRSDRSNELQLCAQAMCLEEMLCCDIDRGAVFYGETKHRSEVKLTPELRDEVRETLAEMHSLYKRGCTPRVKPTKACNACSLKDVCLPRLSRCGSVKSYLQKYMEETP